ncbi:MAG: peptidoglycan DD-metalloendopeptidase family protein [Oscillospiraceae bacterium]|nr:peptidoglycan DD-metalloendopeptidase family protein [Oscillospiraceae bacterium]
MRSRIVISTLIFVVLCSAKVFFPANAAKVKSYIQPAITRESSLRDDCIAIGRAISGEDNSVDVWERLTGRANSAEADPSPSQPAESPEIGAEAAGEFKLSEMVNMNLRGYEDLAGLPAETSPTPQNTPLPSEEPPAESPEASSVPDTASASVVPVAPETLPVVNAEPLSETDEKIDEFLQEQAAFSDYAVPANVSYEAPEIPFPYLDPCACAVTSGFGYREHPLSGVVKFHYGTDLGAVDGTDVTAFADGEVLSVQELDGYGLTVLIQHSDGFSTLYAHLGQALVEQGETVGRGDKIALSGHSGEVTGPHLHFEIIYNGKYLNPEFYL